MHPGVLERGWVQTQGLGLPHANTTHSGCTHTGSDPRRSEATADGQTDWPDKRLRWDEMSAVETSTQSGPHRSPSSESPLGLGGTAEDSGLGVIRQPQG